MKLKIGVIGIGEIAKKAYLPITTRISGIELFISTRNIETQKTIKEEYPNVTICSSIEELLEHNIDGVMIHSSTESHYTISKKLLDLSIPVFIDKPVSNDINQVKELFRIAQKNNVLLRTGFNRRYSPLIRETSTYGIPDIIVYQKNRTLTIRDDVSFIFDDFIHIVDTVRFLMDQEIIGVHTTQTRDEGTLKALQVFLQGTRTSATLIMHRDSGKNEEKAEVFFSKKKIIIKELGLLNTFEGNQNIQSTPNNWEPVLTTRGFESMINKFINDIAKSKDFLKVDLDSLKTHDLCNTILETIQNQLKI